ncbi:hypothetical protein [Streptomyces sp. NPDC126514]|uniref:hypothetical protein n=1 Tax=Streptomyces sp. NPDC126514 TaxID=3155210 RepID=UPI00332CE4B7
MAGLIAMRPGSRTRLCHHLRTHPAGKRKRRSMGERDFIALIDGTPWATTGKEAADGPNLAALPAQRRDRAPCVQSTDGGGPGVGPRHAPSCSHCCS